MAIDDTPVITIEDVCTTNHDNIPQIPVYRPTEDEFKDFSRFIELIEARGAHHMGVCKIIPPPSWVARKKGYSDDDINKLIVPNPILQSTAGNEGIFVQDLKSEKTLTFKEYREYACTKNMTPSHTDWDDLELKYWSNITYAKPQYGANVSGTLTDPSQKVWNIARLPTLLHDVLEEQGLLVDGVNTPYLYYGSWQTTFGWHVEDVDLYSINYLHYGMPKHWYAIPPAYARKFELITRDLYKADFLKCESYMRHKTVVLNPAYLKKQGIPTRKIVQEQNEFMYTFPYGYHSGFNMGLNIAESTNFASPRWIEFGKQASLCHCWADTVKLNMEPFVRQYQSETQYHAWLEARDNMPHPLRVYDKKRHELKRFQRHFDGTPSSTSGSRKHDAQKHRSASPASSTTSDGLLSKPQSPPDAVAMVVSSSRKRRKMSPTEVMDDEEKRRKKKQQHVFFDMFSKPTMAKSRQQRGLSTKSSTISPMNSSNINVTVKLEPEIDSKPYTSCQQLTDIGKVIPRLLRNNFQALWQGNPVDFDVERNFNELIGNFYPHCAVCSIIWSISKASEVITKGKSSGSNSTPVKLPLATEPHIPQMAFSKSTDTKLIVLPQLKSPILRCANCRLTVHARCYGKIELDKLSSRSNYHETPQEPSDSWLCDRCLKFNTNTCCSLCTVRGGALKKISNSPKWAHIVCTLGCEVMEFDDVLRRRPRLPSQHSSSNIAPSSTTEALMAQLPSHRCCVCRARLPLCAPLCHCSISGCSSRVHITCAFFHSLLIESDTYPQLFFLICEKHPNHYSKQPSLSLQQTPVYPGDEVYAVHHPSGYYHLSILQEKVSETFCKLIFPTGEYSDDTEPKYIKSHNFAKEGPPSIGTVVTVLWTDDELADVRFQGMIPEIWKAKLKHSNKSITVNRDEFYKVTETIPDHVQRFLVEVDNEEVPVPKKSRQNSVQSSKDSTRSKSSMRNQNSSETTTS